MKTTHSPGPWHIGQTNPTDNCIPIRSDAPNSNKRGFVAHVDPVSPNRDGNQDANARLIAAAPDLLAALEAAASRLSYLNNALPQPRIWPELAQAEAAIARARGESPAHIFVTPDCGPTKSKAQHADWDASWLACQPAYLARDKADYDAAWTGYKAIWEAHSPTPDDPDRPGFPAPAWNEKG